jgi:1-acyl-sn-glycerol-3-phosphate acyltransferase
MSKIYDLPLYFNLVRRYVIFCFKRYYGEIIVIGKENILVDSPVIFAPNHTNALMDAIAVHAVIPSSLPLIFLARADIFRNETAARFLRYAKIMPAFRMRDGIENLGKNSEIFDMCVEILDNNKALGIMPEGNQEVERKLRPLVKGIFRIAFAAQQKHGINPAVKIVPVGLDFGDIIKSNKHIIIQIGKPIEVSDYMELYSENPVLATNAIRDKLRADLIDLSLNLDSKENYECFESAVKITEKAMLDDLKLADNTLNRFKARQKIAEKLINIEDENADVILKINALCVDFEKEMELLELKPVALEQKESSFIATMLEGLFLLLLTPVFATGFLLNYLPFFSPVYIRKNVFKAQFEGFFSSLQFGLGIITFPMFYIVQALLFGLISGFSGLWIAAFFFAQFPLGKLSLLIYKRLRKWIGKVRYKTLSKSNSPDLKNVINLRTQIIDLVLGK